MTFKAELSIEGIQEAQADNLKHVAALKPRGALGEALKAVTIAAHRAEATRIHVDTGSAKASRIVKLYLDELRGEVTSNPNAVNPRSGNRPINYLVYEFARGGSHDAPGRTVREAGAQLVKLAEKIILRGLD